MIEGEFVDNNGKYYEKFLMKNDKQNRLVEVFAGTSIQAAMVKSLLDAVGIKTYLKDEFMGTLNPWHAAPGGYAAVKVMVFENRVEQAMKIVQEYENNLQIDK